jgi:hypothetical protein
MNKNDELAAMLQEREAHYAEQALRLAKCVNFEKEQREAAAKSQAFTEALELLWKLEPPKPRPWWQLSGFTFQP